MVSLAFIGCGGIAKHHAGCLAELDGDAEIAAAVDVSAEAAQAFAREFGAARAVTDVDEVLADPGIDAVYVCVPTYLHREMTVKAAEAGKHVFLEKPMALSLAEADAIIDAVERTGIRLQVGFVRRFDNCWGKMRELVQARVVGAPMIWRSSAISTGPSRAWFCDARMGMGPLMDGAIHNYDYTLTMWDMPESVFASVHNWRRDVTGPDTGNAIIEYPGGNELVLSWSWGCGIRSRYGFNEIVGPMGTIDFAPSPELIPQDMDQTRYGAYVVTTAEGARAELFERNNMFMDQARHFIEVVRGEREPVVDAREGRRSLEIACALFESAEQGQAVRIDNT